MKWTRSLSATLLVLTLATGVAGASSVIGLSIEDQARLSKYVVVGTIVGQKGVDHLENGLETAVTIKVRSAYKGDARRGDTLVFHTRSGELAGEISTAVGEATFKTGQKALIFIEEVDGRLYNIGLSMGVWDVASTRDGQTSFTRALKDGIEVIGDEPIERGPITAQQMRARVAASIANPTFDHPLLRGQIQIER